MAGVVVLILHREARSGAGPLERWVVDERLRIAEDRREAFAAAGATDVRLVAGPPDDTPFGARLRSFVETERPDGLVVLGSGSIPLARPADLRAFVAVAGAATPGVLTNNRFSSDVVAVSRADALLDVPDLPSDNALPRWLEEACGYPVAERRGWWLGVDVDGPFDLVLLDGASADPPSGGRPCSRPPRHRASRHGRGGPSRRAGRRRADLGRDARLARAEPAGEGPGARRGARAASRVARGDRGSGRGRHRCAGRRHQCSAALLDRDGPASLGEHIARLGDGALIDSRVLLAHRLGADDTALAVGRGSFRIGPAAPGRHRGSVAAGADPLGCQRRPSRSCSAATRSSAPDCASRSRRGARTRAWTSARSCDGSRPQTSMRSRAIPRWSADPRARSSGADR